MYLLRLLVEPMYYRSILQLNTKVRYFFGTAQAQLDDEEKMKALHLLIDKLSPEFKELGDTYAHKSFNRVEIIE